MFDDLVIKVLDKTDRTHCVSMTGLFKNYEVTAINRWMDMLNKEYDSKDYDIVLVRATPEEYARLADNENSI